MNEHAPRMNNVYYLEVNPTFSFADEVVCENSSNGCFELYCKGSVKLKDFQGDHPDEGAERKWNRLFDFSRTFGGVLRDMVLEATGRGHKVDPHFGTQARDRNRENYEKLRMYPDQDPSPAAWTSYTERIQGLQSFTTNAKARELVANYDRMNPHFYVEDFMDECQRNNGNMLNMKYDHKVYVFHHRRRDPEYIHKIYTQANISLNRNDTPPRFKYEGVNEQRISIEVQVTTYKKTSDVEGTEDYEQLCNFNEAFIKHKDTKRREKKYFAGEHEG